MILTKKISKDIKKLAKLVAAEQELPDKAHEVIQKRYIKDKAYKGRVEVSLSKRGMEKHLKDQYLKGQMKHSTILYLIEANLKNRGKTDG